jgi:ATP-dependent helicase/nuclease subunit A
MKRDAASERQVTAADPTASIWLSANAGSGKTRVLTDRVARLLLNGVDPQNILCLTYTKAAASEMQIRLFARLGSWAMKDSDSLRNELRVLGVGGVLDDSRLRKARTLFAQAMETPGGLKIQTIHSFCAGLLRRFPLEAGVSPQFTEMEDRAAALLRAEVVDEIALGPQAHLLEGLARHFTGEDIETLLQEIASEKASFTNIPSEAELRAALGLANALTAETLIDFVFPESDSALLSDLIALCQKGLVTDQKASARLSAISFTRRPTLADLEILEEVFLFGDSAKSPFGAKIGTFPTKAIRATDPILISAVEKMMERVEDARADRLALAALARTQALHAFAAVFVPAYEEAKLRRGMLDFDDLISRSRALLTNPAVAQWVLFRLDGGIDHILVDEAQDTSPTQWSVIEHLAQEFASGEGAQPGRERTIFVVGDKKQSIYSFQGADPEAFDRMQRHFGNQLQNIGQALVPLTLDYSFRSSAAILRVVDHTFRGPHLEGLGPDESVHFAFKDRMPGRVDLWPPIAPVKEEAADRHWTDPVDQVSERHHTILLAEQIADRVTAMVHDGTIPVETTEKGTWAQRRITEGDILILVQRRSDLFAGIIRALKTRKLRVAGADRLRVGAELAVRDIGALLKFLALPEDDLSLAAALKSPLFGWTEQKLYSLAHLRPERDYLWQALRASDHTATLSVLDDLRLQSDFLRPYDLINRILTRHDGRRKLLARLGTEAEDGIDALLSQALAYERTEIPGLTGFVEWMVTDELEVKRQLDAAGDRIRVMTVHGAKGLESPIVILPDTAKRQIRTQDTLIPAGDHRLWAAPLPQMPPAMREVRDEMIRAQERERRRLLYVAMTRAESWLIVCAAGETGTGGESWYAMVEEGMAQTGATALEFGPEPGLRYAYLDWETLPLIDLERAVSDSVFAPDPPALPEYPKPLPVVRSPSDLGGAKVIGDELAGDHELALARGTIIHLLLEHLPSVPPQDRSSYAADLLFLTEEIAFVGDPTDLVRDAIAMIGSPALGPIFASDALTEVDLTAEIPGLGRVHGSIDRLLIGPDRITAIDFKTNRIVPGTAHEVPEGILRQMGAYQAMLAQIYADRPVEVAVLWTATGQLMPIPPVLGIAALQRATMA